MKRIRTFSTIENGVVFDVESEADSHRVTWFGPWRFPETKSIFKHNEETFKLWYKTYEL